MLNSAAYSEPRTRYFMAASALMLAHLVSGKALRDGLFLSYFPASDLPKIVVAAALVSLALGFLSARILARFGPGHAIPWALAAGAALHVAEYAVLQAGERWRGAVAIVVYLQIVGLGAILLSGFWSLINEAFDPREAKRRFGQIAGAGTAGGIAGGLIAERCAAWFGMESLLLTAAVFHLAAGSVLAFSPAPAEHQAVHAAEPAWGAAKTAFRNAPFLANLAVLVLLGTISAALLDFLFKSGAALEFGRGAALTRYFAIFYTVNQGLSFLLQSFVSPRALQNFGVGKTVLLHPATTGLGACLGLVVPHFAILPVVRGAELVLRGSLFRSGYELFFTPVPAREKRAVKAFIDVGCDRLGDALGAGLLQVLLTFKAAQTTTLALDTVIALSIVCVWITARMDAAYVAALERGLVDRSALLRQGEALDTSTMSALMHSSVVLDKREATRPGASGDRKPALTRTAPVDVALDRLAELRSGDATRVAKALRPDLPFEPILVPQAIRLLAWDRAFDWARAFLVLHGHRIPGQLVDALLDTEQDFAIRRRVPRILAYSGTQLAVDGLTTALADPRFEIRFHASRALDFLHRMHPSLRFDGTAVMDALERELAVSRPVREGRKLLDGRDDADAVFLYLDDVLKDNADRTLEHIFSLLAIQLPREPLKIAFRALHSQDRVLRGLALEYLEGQLSAGHAEALRSLAEAGPAAQHRPSAEVMADLMASQASILKQLKTASADAPEPGGKQHKTSPA